jgi:hypothetical protein
MYCKKLKKGKMFFRERRWQNILSVAEISRKVENFNQRNGILNPKLEASLLWLMPIILVI